MEASDLENLYQRYRDGDPAALEELVRQTRVPLYRFILGMVRDPHVAEDVFQDVWFRAFKSLHRYQSDRMLSWLFRIARNRVVDLHRKRKPDLSLQQPAGSDPGARTVADAVPGPARTADREVGDRELAERITRAVDRLPPEQREVFLMRTEAELSFKEIAFCQEVSVNTSLARMQYALQHLRKDLAEDYELLKTL